MKCNLTVSVVLLVLAPVAFAAVTLRPISTIYLPYAYSGETGQYGIDEAAVEQTGYDTTNRIAYSAGNNFIHITDWSDVNTPTVLHRMGIDRTCNDIETCGDYVGFVLEGNTSMDIGSLHIYSLYDKSTGNWTKLHEISVGSKPDMLHFSHDCRTIVVGNEGEAGQNAAQTVFINPEGSVSVVRLSEDGSSLSSNLLNFTQFNERAEEYVARGVRYPYLGELDGGNDTFAQNLEPEYITFNYDDTKAYVALQENNAIAVIDLATDTIEDIHALGEKNWLDLDLDASDKDGGIMFRRSNISSFYQPDGIKYFEVSGEGYIVTANEGDNFEYELGGMSWAEEQRGNDFIAEDFDSSFDAGLINNISDNDILGRLQFSTVDGFSTSDPTKYGHLYFYGGRSFSIFRASDMSLVYDSGDEVERMIAQYYPDVFNTNTKPDDAAVDTPASLADKRSDNLGPECESVEFGELDGRRILFVGVDRTAAILIYSFAQGEVIPTFETVYRAGGRSDSFQDLLDSRNLGDLDPEDLKFIPSSESVTGVPMLMVTSTVSGTVSLYEVVNDENITTVSPNNDSETTEGGPGGEATRVAPTLLVFLIASVCRLLL